MKIKLIILLYIYVTNVLYSQNSPNFYEKDIKAPDVSSLFKKLDDKIEESTGNSNVTIPIYNIDLKSDNLILPIYASYDSNGIKIEEETGAIGASWALKIGGVINRTINGLPDEYSQKIDFLRAYDPNTGNPVSCTQALIKSSLGWFANSTNIISAADYYSLNNSSFQNYSGNGYQFGLTGNTEPDLFNYILPNGEYGSFILKNEWSGTTSKNHKILPFLDSNNQIYKFIVVDEFGNRYIFEEIEKKHDDIWTARLYGSARSSVIQTPALNQPIYDFMSLWGAGICTEGNHATLNSNYGWNNVYSKPAYLSWYLTKIVTSKKNEVNFSYDNVKHTNLTNTNSQYAHEVYNFGQPIINSNKYNHITTKRLKLITFQNGKIQLDYAPNVREDVFNSVFTATTEFQTLNVPSELRALSVIKIFDYNNNIIKKVDFITSYNTAIGFNLAPLEKKYLYKRLWLDKIVINDLEEYNFIYNLNKLPNRFSFEQDYWGFYNNNGSDTNGKSMIPDLWFYPSDPRSYTRTTNFSIFKRPTYVGIETKTSLTSGQYTPELIGKLSNREINESALKFGMLEKIIYPTKGYTKYEYESNDFVIENIEIKGFGLRVKKIEDYNFNDNLLNSTNYFYKKLDNKSSGKVTNIPVFGKIYTRDTSNNTNKYILSSTSISNDCNIYYERITKKLLNNGKIISEYFIPYTIETETSMPYDGSFLYKKQHNLYKQYITCFSMNLCTSYVNGNLIINLPLNTYEYPTVSFNNNFHNLFGKKINEYIYDENSILVSSTYNEYALQSNCQKINVFGKASEVRNFHLKTYVFADFLLKKTIKSDFYNSQIISTNEFIYDNKNQLCEQKSINSDGDVTKTKYEYCYSNLFQFEFNFNDMKSLNMLNYPIVKTVFKNNYLVYKIFNKYYSNNNSPFGITNPVLLKEVYQYETNTTNNDFTEFNWYDINSPNFGLIDPNLKLKFQINKYESNGSPIELQRPESLKTVYLWGYNKSCVIAKIENSTYSEVQQYVENLQNLSNTGTEANLIVALNNLRIALPNAMITTYTHKPLIGVSTITDAKGDIIRYYYDNSNRLQFVKDKDGNILSENIYHYKN